MFNVYLTTNLITGNQYVGDHDINAKEKTFYIGSGIALEDAIKKYGRHNFFKEILEWFPTREKAFNAQEKYIRLYKTHVSQGGYNISWKGGLNVQGCMCDEIRDKISKSNQIACSGEKNGMFGKHHSEETKLQLQVPKSEETKNKIGTANKGKKSWEGKHHTSLSILKMQASHQNMSDKTKEKMSKSRKGKEPWNKGLKINSLIKN
jgi:group I intron endonuclease